MCVVSRARVLFNIPGCPGNHPPLRVSDVTNLHGNKDPLCYDDEPLDAVKKQNKNPARRREPPPSPLRRSASLRQRGDPRRLVPEKGGGVRALSAAPLPDGSPPGRMKQDTEQPVCLVRCLRILFDRLARAAGSRSVMLTRSVCLEQCFGLFFGVFWVFFVCLFF